MRTLCLVSLVLSACASPIDPAAFGYLLKSSDGTYFDGPQCGATLVAPNLAVTAAHCIGASTNWTTPMTPMDYAIRLPSETIDRTAMRVFVMNAQSGGLNPAEDLAILLLDESSSVPPMEIAAPSANQFAQFIGYSDRAYGGRFELDGSGKLRKHVQMAVDSSDLEGSIVAHGIDGGVCFGDSGGALVDARGALIGILSQFAAPLAHCGGVEEPYLFNVPDFGRDAIEAAGRCVTSKFSTDPACRGNVLTRQLDSLFGVKLGAVEIEMLSDLSTRPTSGEITIQVRGTSKSALPLTQATLESTSGIFGSLGSIQGDVATFTFLREALSAESETLRIILRDVRDGFGVTTVVLPAST